MANKKPKKSTAKKKAVVPNDRFAKKVVDPEKQKKKDAKREAKKAERDALLNETIEKNNAAAKALAESRPEPEVTEDTTQEEPYYNPNVEKFDPVVDPSLNRYQSAPNDENYRRSHRAREARRDAALIKEHQEATPAQIAEFNKTQKLEELPSGNDMFVGDPNVTDKGEPIDIENVVKEERDLRKPSSDLGANLPVPQAKVGGGDGIFIPFSGDTSAAIPQIRAEEPTEKANLDMQRRIEKGMEFPGSEKKLVKIKHPTFGEISVTPELAKAHKLYETDFLKNPAQANSKALGAAGAKAAMVTSIDENGKETKVHRFLHPIEHRGIVGGYETLARVSTATGHGESDIRRYARLMGTKYHDTLVGMHNLLQEEKDATAVPENMAEKEGWLQPDDVVVHHETGERIPVNSEKKEHKDYFRKMGILQDNGKLSFMRAKGTTTGIYRDDSGKMHVTKPTFLGWNRSGEAGVGGGTWYLNQALQTPGLAKDEKVITPTQYLKAQLNLLDAKKNTLPTGSALSRQLIHKNVYALSQMMEDQGGTNPSSGPYTLPHYKGVYNEPLPEGQDQWTMDVEDLQESLKNNKHLGNEAAREVGSQSDSPIDAPQLEDVPFGPKVGRKGLRPKFRVTRWADRPDLEKKPDPAIHEGFKDLPGAEPMWYGTSGGTNAGPTTVMTSTSPFGPGSNESEGKWEQPALPGFGIHGSNQFVNISGVRKTEVVSPLKGGEIIEGTENQPREDKRTYRRGTARGKKLVESLQGKLTEALGEEQPISPIIQDSSFRPDVSQWGGQEALKAAGVLKKGSREDVNQDIKALYDKDELSLRGPEFFQRAGVLSKVEPEVTADVIKPLRGQSNPIENKAGDTSFTTSDIPHDDNQLEFNWTTPEEQKAADEKALAKGVPSAPVTSFYNHASGRQWQVIKSSDVADVKAARAEDVFSSTRSTDIRKPGVAKLTGIAPGSTNLNLAFGPQTEKVTEILNESAEAEKGLAENQAKRAARRNNKP